VKAIGAAHDQKTYRDVNSMSATVQYPVGPLGVVDESRNTEPTRRR
jgi:hypothetical protein